MLLPGRIAFTRSKVSTLQPGVFMQVYDMRNVFAGFSNSMQSPERIAFVIQSLDTPVYSVFRGVGSIKRLGGGHRLLGAL